MKTYDRPEADDGTLTPWNPKENRATGGWGLQRTIGRDKDFPYGLHAKCPGHPTEVEALACSDARLREALGEIKTLSARLRLVGLLVTWKGRG